MFGQTILGLTVLAMASGLPEPDHPPPGYLAVQPSYGPPPAPSYGPPPAPSYGAPPPAKYGPPPKACIPNVIYKTMTKDVQGTSMNYGTKYKEHPTTQYAYITETYVAPKTVILYSTMTAYAEPHIHTSTKILYDTNMVTIPLYMTESKYGYNTASQYFTETEAIYVTKTETQSYPMTNKVTKVNIKTQAYYITQTKVQPEYVTVPVTNQYYVTKYATEYKQEYVYNTKTEIAHEYVTMTVWNTVPEYHTVTKCAPPPPMTYGPPPMKGYGPPPMKGYK